MLLRYTIDSADGIDRRGHQRYPIEQPVSLTVIAGGHAYPAVVEDISLSGMRLKYQGDTVSALTVELENPATGRFRGKCMWTAGRHAGIAFEDANKAVPLYVYCLRQMLPARASLEARYLV